MRREDDFFGLEKVAKATALLSLSSLSGVVVLLLTDRTLVESSSCLDSMNLAKSGEICAASEEFFPFLLLFTVDIPFPLLDSSTIPLGSSRRLAQTAVVVAKRYEEISCDGTDAGVLVEKLMLLTTKA